MIRLWSVADDQLVCALNGPWAAVYVVASTHGYGTSVGDPTRDDAFEIVDHDAGALSVAWADCLPWQVARPALLKFAEQGVLGEGVILDGRIPSQLLMLGDYDRAAELETRRPPPVDPARSSLPEKAPQGAWAHRLLRSLVEIQLIEIDTSIERRDHRAHRDAARANRIRAARFAGCGAAARQEHRACARRRRPVRDRRRSADRAAAHAGSPTQPVEIPLT